jgi:flagellar biosynthesis component FlhA
MQNALIFFQLIVMVRKRKRKKKKRKEKKGKEKKQRNHKEASQKIKNETTLQAGLDTKLMILFRGSRLEILLRKNNR